MSGRGGREDRTRRYGGKPDGPRRDQARHHRAPRPDGTCNYRGGGCTEPALEGRWSCAGHAARLERLAEELRDRDRDRST